MIIGVPKEIKNNENRVSIYFLYYLLFHQT